MFQINDNFLKLKAGYLFPEIARRVREFTAANPDAPVIKMGIGDVTEPLPAACVEAMHAAVDEMAGRDTFRGYGPEQGYDFLRDAIAANDYAARGCDVSADEIFVSDGSKCDAANILDVLGPGNTVAVTDPVYPVYVDTNVMAGHTGPAGDDGEYDGLIYLRATADNDFSPALPDRRADVIYLCYPNNPTGTVATRDTLQRWVDYAREHGSLILFDSAYEAYISDESIPHSIYEIEGARECAVEFRSFSKTAGFTGVRAAYTVVPKSLVGRSSSGESVPLHRLWSRRQGTKFNGISYVVSRGAAAVYSPEGKRQVADLVARYMANAKLIRDGLTAIGLQIYGGVHAPYCWVETPGDLSSWDAFDLLLREANVVCTPGSGFGSAGEGYVRLSAFNSRENVEEAVGRVKRALA